MPIPASMASLGLRSRIGRPSMRISPSSGWVSPYRTFMSVVFPAPFSPSSAWICPAGTSRSIPSLATKLPKRLVIPRSLSSSASSSGQRQGLREAGATLRLTASRLDPVRPTGSPQARPGGAARPRGALHQARLDRALRRRLDLAADDALLDLLQLVLQLLRHLLCEHVEGGEDHATVLQRPDVVAALVRALRGRDDRGLDRRDDALLHARDEVLAVRRGADAPVGVHPEHVHVLARVVSILDGRGRTEPDVPGDREDDVRTFGDEGLRQCLTLRLVGECPGELAVLRLLCPPEDLDVGVVLVVVVLHAVPETVHVDRDRRKLLAAVGRNLLRLGHPRGEVPAE